MSHKNITQRDWIMENSMVKIICPFCGQEYDVAESYLGHKVECDCGEKFIAEEARKKCPMCGEKILLSAKKCKHCGEIFGIQSSEKTRCIEPSKAPVSVTNAPKIPETYYPLITIAYIGFAFTGLAILLLFAGLNEQYFQGFGAMLFLPGILLILIGFMKKNVRCSCGYDGELKVRGGSFGCFFLLLLFGILPGLLYLIICQNRYFCPACGREI